MSEDIKENNIEKSTIEKINIENNEEDMSVSDIESSRDENENKNESENENENKNENENENESEEIKEDSDENLTVEPINKVLLEERAYYHDYGILDDLFDVLDRILTDLNNPSPTNESIYANIRKQAKEDPNAYQYQIKKYSSQSDMQSTPHSLELEYNDLISFFKANGIMIFSKVSDGSPLTGSCLCAELTYTYDDEAPNSLVKFCDYEPLKTATGLLLHVYYDDYFIAKMTSCLKHYQCTNYRNYTIVKISQGDERDEGDEGGFELNQESLKKAGCLMM